MNKLKPESFWQYRKRESDRKEKSFNEVLAIQEACFRLLIGCFENGPTSGHMLLIETLIKSPFLELYNFIKVFYSVHKVCLYVIGVFANIYFVLEFETE